jgi:hypothetical protein
MKRLYILTIAVLLSSTIITSCKNDHDYPNGLPEYENYYYAGFLPWNNTKVSVTRNQTTLLKLPVQFHSAFVRDYDAVAQYTVVTTGIAAPAVLNQDYSIVDKSGNVIQPQNGIYTITFPQAKAKTDTIYIKLLNSTVAGTRSTEINLIKNTTAQYTVGTFTDAFRRPIEIK